MEQAVESNTHACIIEQELHTHPESTMHTLCATSPARRGVCQSKMKLLDAASIAHVVSVSCVVPVFASV